ncbi:MAG: peptidylprolyl isomerase [Vicinamibacterales bacterium]
MDFETSKGRFALHVVRSWAPLGADRLFALVTRGFYDGTRFFRVVPEFGVQFGISADPEVSRVWRNARLGVDRVRRSNKAMFVSFAAGMGPDTRTTQLFINLADNPSLDAQGYAPLGWITQGQEVVKGLLPTGRGEDGPEQWRMQTQGNAYLLRAFPALDHVVTATIRPNSGR